MIKNLDRSDPARLIGVMPAAAFLTLGVFLGMTHLISGEWDPVAKVKIDKFEINPVIDNIKVIGSRRKPRPITPVEIPPPPQRIEVQTAQRPSEPIASPPREPSEWPRPVPARAPIVINIDTDEQPIIRAVPAMPLRAERSGHCIMHFDVSPGGETMGIRATSCSDPLFERSAIRAVEGWKYRPKVEQGQSVTRQGLTTRITFTLTDERGAIIPENSP